MAELIDTCGRKITYARISVTDRCNYRCKYCMPNVGVEQFSHSDILSYEEITYLSRNLNELGIEKIRFTGGEPLARKDFLLFLKKFRLDFPKLELSFTTNASLLTKYKDIFSDIELDSINISLDTLSSEKFKKITLLGNINDVLEGINLAVNSKIKRVKINTVLIKGFNDDEIVDLIKFANNINATIRFIEFMPLDTSLWSKENCMTIDEMLSSLPIKYRKIKTLSDKNSGPAEYYFDEETGNKFGTINAVSRHFCSECNRIRFSATGCLRTCLFSPIEIPLRTHIKNCEDILLKKAIIDGVRTKAECWRNIENGHSNMNAIGG